MLYIIEVDGAPKGSTNDPDWARYGAKVWQGCNCVLRPQEAAVTLRKLAENQQNPDLLPDGLKALEVAKSSGDRVKFGEMRDYLGPIFATPSGDVILVKYAREWGGGMRRADEYTLDWQGFFNC